MSPRSYLQEVPCECHVIMISQPQAVTDVIVTAARAVAGSHR